MHDHPRLHVVDPEILVAVVAEGLDDRDSRTLGVGFGEFTGELLGVIMLQNAISRLDELARLLRPSVGDLSAKAHARKPGDDGHPDQRRDGDELDFYSDFIEHFKRLRQMERLIKSQINSS